MSDIPPALIDAFDLVRENLYLHLDEAEFLALKNGRWSDEDITSARRLIPDLCTVIRGLVVQHGETTDGRCPVCRVAWPCPVLETIHRLVKDPDNEFVRIVHRAEDD